MKRRCLNVEPALVRLPNDLLQLVISFAESSLPRILALQLISRHFRDVMSKPNMLNFACVTLKRPTDIPNLGAMISGVRTVKFLFAATSLRALPQMTSLRSLDLSHCKLINNETINIISSLDQLQALNLNDCPRVTDLSKLALLPLLRSLDLSCCYEVPHVPPVLTLESLTMASCAAIRSWELLASMPNLAFLSLSGCSIEDAVLRNLPTGLRHLDLQFCRELTDACLLDIARSTKLEFLNLSGCGKLTHLNPLGNLKNMVEVRLVFCTGLNNLSAIANLPRLRVVYAPHTELTCEALKNAFVRSPAIEHLELSHSRLTHVGLKYQLNGLRRLELRACRMLHDLSDLGFCRRLTMLDLGGCPTISDQALENLQFVPNLVHLDLNTCLDITDQGLCEVAKLSELRYLAINGCLLVKNAGMQYLSALVKLETLDLQGCLMITDAGLHALSSLCEMRILNLSYLVGITDAGLFALLSMTKLVSLHLDSCRKITDVGLHALRSLPDLSSLDLSRCRGVETLCPLRTVTSLRFINLSGCVKVTDASLLNLVQCKDLDVLYSNHCRKITKHGLSMMRQLIAS
jgi:F-box/leucine-rich repeat protein 14